MQSGKDSRKLPKQAIQSSKASAFRSELQPSETEEASKVDMLSFSERTLDSHSSRAPRLGNPYTTQCFPDKYTTLRGKDDMLEKATAIRTGERDTSSGRGCFGRNFLSGHEWSLTDEG